MPVTEAKAVAIERLEQMSRSSTIEFVLIESSTIERPFGWVFFYDSKKHRETGNVLDGSS
jgi:hypothetical protein